MAELKSDLVRLLVDLRLDDQAVQALIEWYTGLQHGVEAFPAAELRTVEPPLRSTPGPAA
jgi:hypothetical protein